MSDIIKFEFDQPVEVALKFPEPKVFGSTFPGGDDRHMFSTTDGRVMYVTPLASAKIKALGVQPGECFFICKRKNGRFTEWEVFREGHEPTAPAPPRVERMPPADRARRLPELIEARNAARNGDGDELYQQLKDSVALVEAKKAAARAETATGMPAWGETLIAHTNVLVDAYAAVLKHSARHEGLVKGDDVRSMMLSAFINLSQKANRNAA